MTIICALHDSNTKQTVFGSNVGALSGAIRIPHSTSTWISGHGKALGLSGQHRQFEILRHNKSAVLDMDPDPFRIAERIRTLFREHDVPGFSRGNDPQNLFGVSMILALPDGIWDIDGSLAPCQIDHDTVWARGSGMQFALGAGFACRNADPVTRVETAIDAARRFDVDSPGERFVEALQPAALPAAA